MAQTSWRVRQQTAGCDTFGTQVSSDWRDWRSRASRKSQTALRSSGSLNPAAALEKSWTMDNPPHSVIWLGYLHKGYWTWGETAFLVTVCKFLTRACENGSWGWGAFVYIDLGHFINSTKLCSLKGVMSGNDFFFDIRKPGISQREFDKKCG